MPDPRNSLGNQRKGAWTEAPGSLRTTLGRLGNPCLPVVALRATFRMWRLPEGQLWPGPRWLYPDQPPSMRWGWAAGTRTPTLAVGQDVFSRDSRERVTCAVTWQAGRGEGQGRVDAGPRCPQGLGWTVCSWSLGEAVLEEQG